MGRTLKRNVVVADGGEDTNGAIQSHEQDDDTKGKFPEKIESEIAEVRERMKSSRKIGSFSTGSGKENDGTFRAFMENASAAEGNEVAGSKSWIPEIVRNGAGSLWPLGERAGMKEIPDPATIGTGTLDPSFRFPAPTNGSSGGGVQKSSVRGTTVGANNSLDSPQAAPAAGHSNSAIVSSTPDENRRKLRALAQKVKLALAQKGEAPTTTELDDGFAEFTRVSEQCKALCTALVLFEVKRRTELHEKMGKADDGPIGQEELVKALEKAPSLMEVRDWRETVAALAGRLGERASRTDTKVAPDGVRSFLGAGHGIYWQQYSRVKEDLSYLTMLLEFPNSVNLPEHTPHGSHDVQRGIIATQGDNIPSPSDSVVRETLPPRGGSTTSQEASVPRRNDTTQEIDISGRGDAILEFSVALGGMPDDTWPRGTPAPSKASFRVSSHILSETSPVFAQLFSGRARETNARGAFPRPRPGVARDGTRVNVYRMSPLLPGEIRPLQILLYAAHMHSDKVPREIGFDHFVAIAKLCLRFQCTAPLELVVEMCWLQEWVHKGVEAMPDGLLLISYAFGTRGLFTRMTKSAILNIVDEADLEARPWPPEVKEKIWAVRQAKMEQIYACCVATVQEYLRPPKQFIPGSNVAHGRPKSIFELDDEEPEARVLSTPPAQTVSQSLFPYLSSSASSPSAADPSFPTSTPRCPKGRHDCDAANLGYFMIVMAELQLLPIILNPGALVQASGSPMGTTAGALPPRSLSQLVKILQRIPSPPNAIHKSGVCDPMQAFRNAVIDIFNSLSGITLYDVTGKHGYAISRKHEKMPQRLGRLQSTVSMPGGPRIPNVVVGDITGVGIPEAVALGILRALDTLRDVRVVAMTSRRFYETYKRHEALLTGRFGEKPQDKQAPCPSPALEVLTEEEARRIIWPDSPASPPAPSPRENGEGSASSEPPPLYIGAAEPEGAREKFRAEDALFTEGKVLSVVETKQLTVEHDVYLGMHRDKVEV